MAHTPPTATPTLAAFSCSFNQLDLPKYTSEEMTRERTLLAIHKGSEGFGFG